MTAPLGFFNPAEVEPGDIIHVAPQVPGNGNGGAFALVVVRQLTPTEVTLFVGDTTPPVGDTWFWVYGPESGNPLWETINADLTRSVNALSCSSITGLIKAHADREAIAALVPVRTSL